MSLEENLRSLPMRARVDVLIAVSPENFVYVSGTHIITVKLLPPRQAFAIIPRNADPALLVCSIEQTLAEEESWIKDVRAYTEFVDYPIDALVGVLKDRGLTKGRLGIDLKFLPHLSYVRLAELLPDMEIIDTTDEVAKMRAVKTEGEIAKIEFAAKTTHEAAVEAMAASKLGETEKTMASRMTAGLLSKGAESALFMVFASGERTRLTHGMPTERVPRESEIIRFDVGGTYGPWMSDFARAYSTGNPTEIQRQAYRNLREIEEETINSIRPGILAEDVFHTAKTAFEKRGMPFHMPHVGHGFGVELHEDPMLRPGDKTTLQKGMVFNIEVMVIDKAGSMYHLEDLVVTVDDGCRILTHGLPPKDIPVIGKPLDTQ